MARPITLTGFYDSKGNPVEPRPQMRAAADVVPELAQPAPPPPRASVLTPAQRQAIIDGLVAARAAKRLAEFAGVRVTPGKLAGVAVAALAVFGGYKWYKSRSPRRRKRRIKNSLLGG